MIIIVIFFQPEIDLRDYSPTLSDALLMFKLCTGSNSHMQLLLPKPKRAVFKVCENSSICSSPLALRGSLHRGLYIREFIEHITAIAHSHKGNILHYTSLVASLLYTSSHASCVTLNFDEV